MELISKRVREICTANPPPYRNLQWAIMPDPEGDPCLYLTFFVDNWVNFSDSQQSSIAEWAGSLVMKIRMTGIPCYIQKLGNINEV